MKSSAAYFTHRPLSSYPPEDDDEERQQNEDPGVFAGVLHEPSSAPERLGMWWQQQHRRTKALCGVLVLAVLFAVVGEALYVLVTGLRGVPPGLWSRHGVLTVGKDTPFHIKGASWYGMEHERHCLEGLDKTGLTNVLNELVRQDFNALRIPLALDSFNRDPLVDASSVSTFANPDLSSITYRQLLREVVQRAAERNILIMLDLHRLDSKKWPTDGKWVPEHLGIEGVYSFWRELATEYRDQWNVMGADLFNEPHGAEDWKSWREFVEVTGNMIHTIAPRWLIVAEGVGALKNDPRPRSVFWAENLHPAITDPPVLKERRKVALSPHVYGPSVYNQSYFGASDFPRNMAEIWDDVGSVVSLGIYVHFGDAANSGLALIVGEWGGWNVGRDALWQDAFARYMTGKGIGHFYWCLNPGSADTGGIFKEDWSGVHTDKIHLLERTPSTKVESHVFDFKRKP